MKHAAAILILAALLAVGAFALLGFGGDPALPPSPVVTAEATPAEAAATRSGELQAEAGDASARPSDGAAAERSEIEVRQSLLPIPEDAAWISLRIVDKESGKPVPGATVGWFDQTVAEALNKQPELSLNRFGQWRDTEAIAQAYGWLTTADDRGIARLHQAEGTRVFARDGNRYGAVQLGKGLVAPPGGYELPIEADFSLRVRAVTADGKPACGLPIGIGVFSAKGKLERLRSWGPETLTSSPDGEAVLAHLQDIEKEYAPTAKRGGSWRVVAAVPGAPSDGPVFTPTDVGGEPIILHLPPMGSVRAKPEVLDLGSTAQQVYLRERSNREGMWNLHLATVVEADGWAHFPFVPLGLELAAHVGSRGGWIGKEFSGPTAAGTEIEVVLTTSKEHILLAGRVVDEARKPVGDIEFAMTMTGGPFNGPRKARTAVDGTFTVLVGTMEGDGEVDGLVLSVEDAAHGTRTARLPGRQLRPGCEQLGDLVLGKDPILVAGRFTVDGVGCKPKLNTQLQHQEARNGGEPRWRGFGHEMPPIGEDGAFEVRGVFKPGRYRLTFWGGDYQAQSAVEFESGTANLKIALQTGSTIAATILMPEGIRGDVDGKLVPIEPAPSSWSEAAKERLSATSSGGANGRRQISWRGLPAGRFRFELRLQGFAEVLVAFDDVVTPQPTPPDARLLDIDLRPLVRSQELKIIGAGGGRMNAWEGALLPMPQTDPKMLVGLPPMGGDQPYLMPNRPVELLLAFSGYQPQRVFCTGQPLEVSLQAWPTATIVLPPIPNLPAGWTFRVKLDPQPNLDPREFRSMWNSGKIADLLGPPTGWTDLDGGKAEVPVGETPQRIYLQARQKRRAVDIPLSPQSASMVSGTVTLVVDPAAVLKAVADTPKSGG